MSSHDGRKWSSIRKFDMLVEMNYFCIPKIECEDEMMAKLMRQF